MSIEETYSNDRLEGDYKKYNKQGNIEISGTYKESMRVGTWNTFDEKGKNVSIYNYNENGKMEGKQIQYTPTDFDRKDYFKRESEFKNGLRHGTVTEYYPNGKVYKQGRYEMDEKEGRWVQYSGEIIISEENYKAGKRDGVQRFFYTNGKIAEEYIYENGKEKEYKRYSQDGKLIGQGKRF